MNRSSSGLCNDQSTGILVTVCLEWHTGDKCNIGMLSNAVDIKHVSLINQGIVSSMSRCSRLSASDFDKTRVSTAFSLKLFT